MFATIQQDHKSYRIDLSKPLDLSIPLLSGSQNPVAWYLDPPTILPVTNNDWIGKVSEGAAVNFNTIHFNPHAHGTHTEGIGHITPNFCNVQQALDRYFFEAYVISVQPKIHQGDQIITKQQIETLLSLATTLPEALIIRTLPNTKEKLHHKYSHTNWPYLTEEAALYLREIEILHLLIDLPSVDKEKDEGKLLAHKAFWNYPEAPRMNATITEFIFVPDAIGDGTYLMNLQMANFVNDATPSRPVLYKIL